MPEEMLYATSTDPAALEAVPEGATSHDAFDVYAVAIQDTNELKNYGQRIDSVYVTILTLILAGDGYVAAASRFDSWIPVAVTVGIGIVGFIFCQRWQRGLINLNDILNHRYEWLRELERTQHLRGIGANLFTSEYEEVYQPSGLDSVARRRNRQIQSVFRIIFIAIPLVLGIVTLAATNPWLPWLHQYIEPLLH
jgi:hypothetical protein